MIATLLTLATTKIGQYVIIGALAISLLGGAVLWIRHDAVQSAANKGAADATHRLEDAIRSGDAVNTDPSKLRQSDPQCRDC